MDNSVNNPLIQTHDGPQTFQTIQVSLLITIDSMRESELLYLLSVWNESSDQLEKFHKEAASSGRLKAATVLSTMMALEKSEHSLYVAALRTTHDHAHYHLMRYIRKHNLD